METHHAPGYENGLDIDTIQLYQDTVNSAEQRLRRLLPGLPTEVTYAWFNEQQPGMIVAGFQTGGTAWNPSTISIAVVREGNQPQIHQELFETVYHEGYHLVQGLTYLDAEDNPIVYPVLNIAISEGAASVFEREYARKDRTLPYYADYTKHTTEELNMWLQQLRELPTDLLYEEIIEWKFYHQELGVNHIMYKVGAWIVDRALVSNKDDTIIDYATMDLRKILVKAGMKN